MAAGLVSHSITTASGVTFAVKSWVPDTSAPDVGAIPVHLEVTSGGLTYDFGSGTGGSATQRIIVDSSQLAALVTTAQNMATASGGSLVILPTDQNWGVGATGFTKLEDAASADGDKGIPAMVVRKATPADSSGTDADYEFLQIKDGQLWVASKATDKTLLAERTIAGGSQYEPVAASASAQALGATGATGDYLECLVCVVATAATSQVQIKDGSDTAITVLPNAVGAGVGTYTVPIGLISRTGAWQINTAAGVSVLATGKFT